MKKFALPFRAIVIERGIEAGEPQSRAERENEHGDPADAALLAKSAPGEEHDGGGNAEVDEVGEAIQLGAKAG